MRILGIDNKIIYFFQRDLQAWNMAHNLLKNQIKRIILVNELNIDIVNTLYTNNLTNKKQRLPRLRLVVSSGFCGSSINLQLTVSSCVLTYKH